MSNTLINKVLDSNTTVSSLVLRVPLGLVLAAHGAQKLFGWFGGYGLEGTGQWMASIGFEPGYLMALLAGSGEFFGGLALVLGLLTRPAALVTGFTMLMALTFHWPNGLFLSNNGYEYALMLTVASLTLAIQGAGRWSLDHWLLQQLAEKSAQNKQKTA
ncbi:DoxX family protein [Vibrio sp.]|uniref:DoxX family protein n=1 Tax=Vibrio sp. TaxID=678 RepID=UPI003D112C9F